VEKQLVDSHLAMFDGAKDVPVKQPDVITQLKSDHHSMRALFETLRGEIDLYCAKKPADLDLSSEIMEHLIIYPDLSHHHREDVIFERLKLQDVAVAQQVESIIREHKDLVALNRRLAAALRNIRTGLEMPRDWLDSLARACVASNFEHMNKENQFYFPLAVSCLSTADWEAIATEIEKVEDSRYLTKL